MKSTLRMRVAAVFLMMTSLMLTDLLATCGGGGGGGTGGLSGSAAETYPVPWKNAPTDGGGIPAGGLIVYWFPASQNEFDKSSLRNSRALSLYASQCISMGVADSKSVLGAKFMGDEKVPVAVLAQADGTVIGKAPGKDGFLRVAQVEKLVEAEVKLREAAIKLQVNEAKDGLKKGDKDAAIGKYKAVLAQQCLFPKQAKDAEKELKKLGVTLPASTSTGLAPVYDPAASARIEATMKKGLVAENAAKFAEAERLYTAAARLDPADPAPKRYLGELYRHHIGDWAKARQVFNALLAAPSDPLSRAVALHGLGKMTIHDGEFAKGRSLMEDSVREFPIALTYRNLAVYWNSEGDVAQADKYTKLALALDPQDPFNLIFSAAFLAGNGHADEALKIAVEHQSLLSASYNLAAIYAQIGQKEKAMTLLRRHFFEYERTDAVRAKEMMEARVDAVFATLVKEPEFLTLTSGADGKLAMPKR